MIVRFPQHGLTWKLLGMALMQMGQYVDALAPMKKAAALSQGDSEAHYYLGVIFRVLGQLEEAEVSYRQSLLINPDDAATHYNLGFTLKELGRLEEAEASYQRSLQINPNDADTHYNLGNTLKELGRQEEAEASYRQALVIKSDFVYACYNLGNTLKELGRLEEAGVCYRRAQVINPDFVDAHYNLGVILNDLGQLDEAEISLRRALEIKPDLAEAHYILGKTLNDLGRIVEAEMSLRRALEIKPDYAEVLVEIGNMSAHKGFFAEAEAFFQRALTIEPEMPWAWAAITTLRKMTPADADWLATAERTVLLKLSPKQESKLRYAMGKYCDDVKDFDDAFLNYRRANELKKSFSKRYDCQQWTDTVDHLIHDYSLEGVRHIHEGASSSNRPLFIVGMPRSGTSITEQIIASHSEAFGAGELPFWSNAAKRLYPFTTLANLNGDILRNLADECLRNLASFSAGALRVVDKMPGNFLHLGIIHAAFPNARIIHTQRNPVDTCLSIYFQDFMTGHTYANDLEHLAHYYKEYHRLMAHWRAALTPKFFLDVPYEALVEDQEVWSRKIIEFIGLDWEERCLDFHMTERKVRTASSWQVRQKMYKTSRERWRNYEKFVEPLMGLLDLHQ